MTRHRSDEFAPLAPWQKKGEFDRVIRHVIHRSLAARRHKLTLVGQLLVLARPTLAFAAGIALVVWISAVLLPSPNQDVAVAQPSKDTAFEMVRWATTGEVPSPWEMFSLVGGRHEQ